MSLLIKGDGWMFWNMRRLVVALPLLTAVIVVDLFTSSSCKFYIKKAGMHTHSESLFRRTARNKFANPLAFSWRVPRLVFISRMSL